MRLVEKIAEKMWENTAKSDAKRIALQKDRKSTRLNSSHNRETRMPSSA